MSLRSIVLLLTLSQVLTAADLRGCAAKTGLRFEHATGAAGGYFMPEIVGSGVALLDYTDTAASDLDVYFVQGRQGKPDRLFRNRLSEDGALRFEDVTEQAGIPASEGFGMGVATGDIDNDGDVDLFHPLRSGPAAA